MRCKLPRQRRLVAAATAGLLALAAGGVTFSDALDSAAAATTGDSAMAGGTGCGGTPTLTTGMHSLQSGGMNRDYALRVPGNYDRNHAYRLIFAFHWRGGTGQQVASGGTDGDPWAYYGLMQLSNNSAIFVAPQGLGNGWANNGGQDDRFVDDMIKQIEGDLCVDKSKVFSMGFSYGGAMSYALACDRATVFRAVAVYSGGVFSGCNGAPQPVAYIGIQGVGDTVADVGGARALRDRFVSANGCAPQNAPEPNPGSQQHIVTVYSGCRPGYPVEWAAFDGGHDPGPVDGGGSSGVRTWTKGEVWKFFSQF
jgi:poly(3-hydroxybutyrate) depolymerase